MCADVAVSVVHYYEKGALVHAAVAPAGRRIEGMSRLECRTMAMLLMK